MQFQQIFDLVENVFQQGSQNVLKTNYSPLRKYLAAVATYVIYYVFFLPAHGLQTHLQIKSRFSCFEEYNDDIPPSRFILAGRKKTTFFGFSD